MVRFNNRFNMFNYSTIFIHGWGFKIAYELPTTMSHFRRDVDFYIEDYIAWIDKQQFYYTMAQYARISLGGMLKYVGFRLNPRSNKQVLTRFIIPPKIAEKVMKYILICS